MANLGYLIQDARKQKNLSVETVAEKTGLSVGSIRAYEQSRRYPSVKSFKLIESVLGLSGNWLNANRWEDADRTVHQMVDEKGSQGIRQPKPSRMIAPNFDVEEVRRQLIRDILDADADVVCSIYILLSKDKAYVG